MPVINLHLYFMTVLSGRKASTLYLKCLQLILQKQLYILVQKKGFREELEVSDAVTSWDIAKRLGHWQQVVVRDLWALRLQKVLERYKTAAQTDHDHESTTNQVDGDGTAETNDDDGYSSEYLSSDAEVDHAVAGETDFRRRKLLLRQKRQFKLPSLTTTVALCYLGAILLRVPLTLGDLLKGVDTHEIVYTDALREVPTEITNLLPGNFIMALKPVVGEPSPEALGCANS